MYKYVDKSIFEKIIGASTSKEVWDILVKVLKRVNRVKEMRLQTLRGDLEAIKVNNSTDVSSYITCVQVVANQLKHMEKPSQMQGLWRKFFNHH